MNILVIGNGFDLAHGLKTSYKDFLTFISQFLLWQECQSENNKQVLDKNTDYTFLKFFKRMDDNHHADYDKLKTELDGLIRDNLWIEYFNKIISNNDTKNNWIDFEKEIAKIVQILDKARCEVKINMSKIGDTAKLSPCYQDVLKRVLKRDVGILDYNTINNCKTKLKNDLDGLTRCLEIYLSYYVNTQIQNISHKIPEIESIQFEKVISFNYTNTCELVYGGNDIKYDYIHGKAEFTHSIDECNMVIGIDEYLTGSERDTDNEFIEFKKFYQRIYKMTGSKYIDWLREYENTPVYNDKKDCNIYFFGHSLDVTDKDIIARLINTPRSKTTIFYHSKEALASQISNLVKVIGEETLIKRTGGTERTIVFQEVKSK